MLHELVFLECHSLFRICTQLLCICTVVKFYNNMLQLWYECIPIWYYPPFSVNSIKIPLKCHQPIKIPDNGIEFFFILLKFHQFPIIFTVVLAMQQLLKNSRKNSEHSGNFNFLLANSSATPHSHDAIFAVQWQSNNF